MDDKSLVLKDKYIDVILKCLQTKDNVPDDVMYLFYSKTLKVVQEKAYDAVTEHAKDFCLYMSNLWNARAYLELNNPTLIFQLGELHTCARLLDNLFEEKEKEHCIELNSKGLFNRLVFFQFIAENPGIKHSDLATKMGMSKSSLSQFVSRIQRYGYHYERKAGREKYYYLSKTGSRLLEIMKLDQHKIEQEDELQFLQKRYTRQVRILYLLYGGNAAPSREKRLVNSLISLCAENTNDLLYLVNYSKHDLVDNYHSWTNDYILNNKIDSRLQMARERAALLEYIIYHCILDTKTYEKNSLFDYMSSFTAVNSPQLDEQPDKEFENTACRLPSATVPVELVRVRNEKSDWGNNINTKTKSYSKVALSV